MIVIIGAGISGLYIGYMLYQNKIPFMILESNRLGGKIVSKTSTSCRTPIELGASIFHSNQEHIMGLINQFSIPIKEVGVQATKYLVPIPSKVEEYPSLTKTAQPVYKVLTTPQKQHNPSYNEIKEMNYNDWKQGDDKVGKVYVCKNGLHELVECLKKYVSPYVRKIEVKKIDIEACKINDSIRFDTVVVCTSALQARKIRVKGDVKVRWQRLLRASKTIASVRVYAEFYKKIPYSTYIVGLEKFRWYIPVSQKVALLSYVDGSRASDFIKKGEEGVIKEILEELRIKREDIKKLWYAPWKDGFNVLNYKVNTIFKEDMEQVKEGVMYESFLPEACSQAWMEGHLIQSYKIVEKIKKFINKDG